MKGRKRYYDNPVQKNFSVDSWVVSIIEECKKFGIKPNDIVIAGIRSILGSSDKLPVHIYEAFITAMQPKVDELTDSIDLFKELSKQAIISPAPSQQEKLIETTRAQKRAEEYHVVRLKANKNNGDVFLFENEEEFKEHESLFENLDTETEIDCTKLPKFYSIIAVMKRYAQIKPEEGDLTT
jgi:hypothetical protein